MGTVRYRIDQWGNEVPPDWLEYNGIKPESFSGKRKNTHYIIDNKVVMKKEVIVHTFSLGDVDDPDLYAAEPLYQWQKSEAGSWVMENCCDDVPVWNRYADPTSYGYKYIVKATFEEKKLTEFYLRFGKPLK